MTVAELRKELEKMPDDFEVVIAYERGDYYDSTQAEFVTECYDGSVIKSDTFRGYQVEEENAWNEYNGDRVCILGNL